MYTSIFYESIILICVIVFNIELDWLTYSFFSL